MPVVRPRTVSLEPDEMIKLGQEMIDWVVENDPLHLSQWYTIHKGFTYNEWKTFYQCAEFFPYYEQALKLVGIKYLDGESKKIKQGISERWLRVYFKDLKEQEDQDKDEAEARKARSLMTETKIIEEKRLEVCAAVLRGKQEIK